MDPLRPCCHLYPLWAAIGAGVENESVSEWLACWCMVNADMNICDSDLFQRAAKQNGNGAINYAFWMHHNPSRLSGSPPLLRLITPRLKKNKHRQTLGVDLHMFFLCHYFYVFHGLWFGCSALITNIFVKSVSPLRSKSQRCEWPVSPHMALSLHHSFSVSLCILLGSIH